jgi:hypothetical protein
MGILGRFASVLPGITNGSIGSDDDPLAKTLREVRNGSASLSHFLRERHLISSNEGDALERGRQRVEKSGLLRMMEETCTAINELAGRTVVDAHSFLAPDPTLGCFIFVEGSNEFILRLELRGASPLLVFAERKWRDMVTNDFLRWAYRLVEVEPMSIAVKQVYELQDDHISAAQVRRWFFYLISGFDRSYAPTFGPPAA